MSVNKSFSSVHSSFRYTVAGVMNQCMLATHDGIKDCCLDPIVYQRVNEEIKSWIWQKAPGVRESVGCPKKEIPSMIDVFCASVYLDLYL